MCSPGLRALAATCLLLLANNPSLHGSDKPKPSDYALIYGTVWGPDDRPIYGVAINIRRTDQKKPKWHVYSDHHGVFAQRVPVGKADYEIWADINGLKLNNGKHLYASPRVIVHVESNERVDTGLHLQ